MLQRFEAGASGEVRHASGMAVVQTEGPGDARSCARAGATDIVSALHHVPIGDAWTRAEVERYPGHHRDDPARANPLRWTVVESIPVPDDVKRLGRGAKRSIEAWIASLEAAAAAGLKIVCYNFMPVLDWTRTDLDWPLPTRAGPAVRSGALRGLRPPHPEARRRRPITTRRPAPAPAPVADALSDEDAAALTRTLAAGLPGTTTEALDLEGFRGKLDAYRGVDATQARANLVAFLEEVTPAAEALGASSRFTRTIRRAPSSACRASPRRRRTT